MSIMRLSYNFLLLSKSCSSDIFSLAFLNVIAFGKRMREKETVVEGYKSPPHQQTSSYTQSHVHHDDDDVFLFFSPLS